MKRSPGLPAIRGFSLIEVVVAMTIFAGGVLGVVTAFSLSTRASGSAMREAGAARLAQRLMVDAVNVPSRGLVPAEGQEDGYAWTRRYDTAPVGPTTAEVTVRWQQRGETQSFTLRELFLPASVGPGATR